ncbi:hypothetical protein C8R44DRAFT_849642 [Mycena epipterygia]|nr:hypothetical protein C8R44DRAFT_849642 [Mycena epipterygia]
MPSLQPMLNLMVSKNQLFGDEKPTPAIGNLTTHLKDNHKGVPLLSDVMPGRICEASVLSGSIMKDFILEGKLNPVINSMQANFLKIFTMWMFKDDLPFTMGKTPSIQCLFTFLHTRSQLPSDTTDIKSKITASTNTWTTCSMTFTFAGTIRSWITSDWELVEQMLDFPAIEDKEHEGEYVTLGLTKRLADLQTLEKMSASFLLVVKLYGEELAPSGREKATLMVVRDVRHRWNYTHKMIKHGWLMRKLFTKVTLQMSCLSTPMLPWVLPMYKGMLKHLQTSQDNKELPNSLHNTVTAGLIKLETYFLKAWCQLNIIMALLHPSLVFRGFAKWTWRTHQLSSLWQRQW